MASLFEAVKALLPSTVTISGTALTPDVFDTIVRKKPSREYWIVTVRLPRVSERSEGASVHAHGHRVRVTSVARTPLAVRGLADAVELALDQARVTAAGWGTGLLLAENATEPTDDPDVTFTDGTTAVFAVTEFVLTASRTA